MSPLNIILLIIAILNLLLGVYVVLRNYRSRLRWSFFALTVAVFLWCLAQVYQYSNTWADSEMILTKMAWTYLGAVFIPITFLFFAYRFPLDTSMKNWQVQILIWPFFVLLVAMLLNKHFIIQEVVSVGKNKEFIYNIFGYLAYVFYFLFYMGLGFSFLIKRYSSLSGILRYQTGIILFGIGIDFIFGVLCSLVLTFGNVFDFDIFWPYFSLFMVFGIAYMMYRAR